MLRSQLLQLLHSEQPSFGGLTILEDLVRVDYPVRGPFPIQMHWIRP